jgi:anti-sigma B factor antagonist
MDFSLALDLDPPTARLTANGELDIFTARQVSRQLTEAISAGCRQVLVDVGGVTFVDASALGVFARALATLQVDDGSLGSLGFRHTSPPFRRLCKLTGLDVVFDLN